ncbi:unnamed protein product [Sphagnum jensenii]|uniref:DYW domain-containing protein n=1 Tax=Sphagnum jensenii TaxID=128206 RepID=A0ABP1C179_9BRYO
MRKLLDCLCCPCSYLLLTNGFFGLQARESLHPDPVTFVGMLKACAGVLAFEESKCAHQHIIHSGCKFDSIQTHYEYDGFVGNNLVDMYAKCGSMADAWRLFSKMHSHNENSTNQVLELDLGNSAGCAMLSNIYALAGKWDLSANVQWQRLQWSVKNNQHTAGTPICIFKNLQICRDCHTSTKFISNIVKREIIVRDTNQF